MAFAAVSQQTAWNQTVMDIDPEFAAEILAGWNGRNRPLSPTHVSRLAAEIQQGRWKLLPNGITFDPANNLLDGQHRLAAIVKTGMSVPMTVTYDVDPAAFAAMDSVVKIRSAGDVLTLNTGLTKYASAVPATLRLLRNYEAGTANGGSSSQISNMEMIELHGRWSDVEQLVRVGLLVRSHTRLNATAVAAGLALIARENPSNSLTPWLEGVTHGVSLTKGDPRLALRQFSVSQAKRKTAQDTLSRFIRAWNAWTAGEEVLLLRPPIKDPYLMPTKLPSQRHNDKVASRSIADFSG